MYRTVLIPTDGSTGAGRGVTAGVDIAKQYGATVHALYVVDERIYGQTPALSDMELRFEQLEAEGEGYLEEIVARATEAGLDVETSVQRGMPHEIITTYADENDVDLIVMGRHGASAHPAPHIGSCTDRVLRTAPVPVLPA
ncbi:universal stress protein [Salinigranum rubrum]|uniref:Universal stress protein n=1 Tax=Salinigranum rubrum TaxID=755307 RepID=A0A2I8VQ06_9EURY|nr:universal stress protein [Salinigranum rubrum]AUV83199.1 universal stress protein [Salinigranum rubrum]